MKENKTCDFNCDDCKKILCTQGNPTLEKNNDSEYWVDEMDRLQSALDFWFSA